VCLKLGVYPSKGSVIFPSHCTATKIEDHELTLYESRNPKLGVTFTPKYPVPAKLATYTVCHCDHYCL
jgi:hypothetical protein